ncbi:hypothetical protein M9458_051601 [Cirrhinus mrigala]|uniref:Integrase zinc-binding domain-containing protein n=1 Tax=Cirrhinus mrigala TaxID=683832 RepID=A0ABD0MSW1_CIRMR
MNHDEKLTASAEENAEETMSIIDRASEAGSKRSHSSRMAKSSRSTRSSRISVSIAAATARAQAEAARVQFVKEEKCREWEMWRNSPQDLERIHVQRTYSLKSLSKAKSTELCIFSDASFKAIGAVPYLKTTHEDGQINVGFVLASLLANSMWLSGPDFLYKPTASNLTLQETFELVNPETDSEVRPLPQVNTAATRQTCKHIGWHKCDQPNSLDELAQAKRVILLSVQKSVYPEEYSALMRHAEISQSSPLIKLNPVLDEDGLIRVGGHLTHAPVVSEERNPIVLPGRHHMSTLLIRHFDEQVKHQGRLLTEEALRTVGFWLINGKRSIRSVIHKCVVCRKLRGNTETQKMADLPEECLSSSPLSLMLVWMCLVLSQSQRDAQEEGTQKANAGEFSSLVCPHERFT